MPVRRSYHQFCGLARALDRVGERWTLLVVRNLLLGPRRYGELLEGLPGITTNLLAKRLKEMTELGLIEKRPEASARDVYALTELGAELEPAVMELARWGGHFLGKPSPRDRMDIGWGLLSMKRRYRGGLSMVVELAIGERTFELAFSPSYLAVQERAASLPQLRLRGDLAAFRALFFGQAPARTLLDEGKLAAEGKEAALAQFLGAFEGVVSSGSLIPEAEARRSRGARAPARKSAAEEPRAKAGRRQSGARAGRREA